MGGTNARSPESITIEGSYAANFQPCFALSGFQIYDDVSGTAANATKGLEEHSVFNRRGRDGRRRVGARGGLRRQRGRLQRMAHVIQASRDSQRRLSTGGRFVPERGRVRSFRRRARSWPKLWLGLCRVLRAP